MELSEKDKILLAYLDHGAREPISKIAKQCKLSREQVNYKISKFQKEGLIRNFVTFFNYPKLGYKILSIILIKFSFPLKNKNIKFMKNTISHSTLIGEYDYFITFISEDEHELNKKVLEFANENKEIIKEYRLLKPYFSENYNLKFLSIKKPEYSFTEYSATEKLSRKEIQILKIIEKDAMIKIVDIAKKAGISAELALYHLRNLQKRRIILGTKIHFDMKKLGYSYSVIEIELENFSKEIEEKIKKFARNDKLVNSLSLSIEKPQMLLQLFNKTQEELMDSIKKMKEILPGIKSLNIMFPEQEEEINTLPDLEK